MFTYNLHILTVTGVTSHVLVCLCILPHYYLHIAWVMSVIIYSQVSSVSHGGWLSVAHPNRPNIIMTQIKTCSHTSSWIQLDNILFVVFIHLRVLETYGELGTSGVYLILRDSHSGSRIGLTHGRFGSCSRVWPPRFCPQCS